MFYVFFGFFPPLFAGGFGGWLSPHRFRGVLGGEKKGGFYGCYRKNREASYQLGFWSSLEKGHSESGPASCCLAWGKRDIFRVHSWRSELFKRCEWIDRSFSFSFGNYKKLSENQVSKIFWLDVKEVRDIC